MIWRRAVASQMQPGRDKRTKVITKIAGYDFTSRGNVVLFDGHRQVWTYSQSGDVILPPLFESENCSLASLEKDQKFTQPPPRYSTASIIKKCEDEQIGRPATYAALLKTIQDRKYVTVEKKAYHPTELGMKVIDFLKKADICFVDLSFTADMELRLDEVQAGTITKVDVLEKLWTRLKADIEKGKQIKDEQQKSDYDCPKCDGKLLLKHSHFGAFFSCENYKKPKKGEKGTKIFPDGSCQYIAKVGEHGEPVEKVVKPKEYASFQCKKCKSKMVKRASKFGEFYGCEAFPKCRATSDMDGNFKDPKKKKKWGKKKSADAY